MVTEEFKREVDARVELLGQLQQAEGFRVWLWIEDTFDSLQASPHFAELVTRARRLYHLRVHVTGTKPTALAAAFTAAFAKVLEDMGGER